MKISQNNNSLNIQPKEKTVQNHQENLEHETQRTVQKSVYEKGSPRLSGEYFNPSFGSAAIAKATSNVKVKNDLEKLNNAVKGVLSSLSGLGNASSWDKTEKKIEIFEKIGFDSNKARNFVRSFENDTEFANYVAILKCEGNPDCARDIARGNFDKFKTMLEKGDSIKDAQYLVNLTDEQEKAARKIIQNNVSAENATKAVFSMYDEQELAEYTKKYIDITKKAGGYNTYTRALANLSGESYAKANKMLDAGLNPAQVADNRSLFNHEKFDDIVNLAGVLNKLHGVQEDNSLVSKIARHLDKHPDTDVKGFSKYINNLDKNKLVKIDSSFNDFTESDWLKFADFHYKLGTKTFDKKALTFPKDLTNYLSQNYLDGKGISALFKVYPSTAREVGEMPPKWNIKTQAQKDKLYEVIEQFRNSRDTSKLSKDLTGILGQKASVSEIASGAFGTGYKVSVEGADDVCLKMFHKEKRMDSEMKVGSRIVHLDLHRHGQDVEPQAGLYVNENARGFVKMFFGKVAPNKENDGFYVTQYLNEKIKPIEVPPLDKPIKAGDVVYGDMKPDNVINGKIIDYGGIRVVNSDGDFTHWKVGNLLKD